MTESKVPGILAFDMMAKAEDNPEFPVIRVESMVTSTPYATHMPPKFPSDGAGSLGRKATLSEMELFVIATLTRGKLQGEPEHPNPVTSSPAAKRARFPVISVLVIARSPR